MFGDFPRIGRLAVPPVGGWASGEEGLLLRTEGGWEVVGVGRSVT
jgi:hypothetical protein